MKKANGRETLDIWKKNSAENISLREFKLMTNLINYLKEKYSTTDQIKKDDQAQKEWRNVTNKKKKKLRNGIPQLLYREKDVK